jgi:hypothetical protein
MKILKGIALGFVAFFLCVSLSFLTLFITLHFTLLNPDFAVKEVGKLDLTEVAREYINTQMDTSDLPYSSAIDATLTEEKPWIDQQARQIIFTSYDYLLGLSDQLRFTISLEEVKQDLANNLVNAAIKSPPPEYQSLSPAAKEQYLLNLKKQYLEAIPSSYDLEINQETIGPDGMKALGQIKELIGYFQFALWFIIGFFIIMILLIVLIQLKLQGVTRVVGIVFLIEGALSGLAYLGLKTFIPLLIPLNELPNQFNTWLPGLINDFLLPCGICSLVVLIIGGISLAASFLIKDEQVIPAG